MTRRWTFFHHLPEPEARALLLESVERCGGNLVKVARDVDLSRLHVYRLLHRWKLWDRVDEVRAARRTTEPDWRRRARAALVGSR